MHAQTASMHHTTVHPDISEQIGLMVTFKSTAATYECGCEFRHKKKKCNLYAANTDSCIFIRDDSLKTPIGKIFVLIESKKDTFAIGRPYLITAKKSYYGYFILYRAYPYSTKFTELRSGNVVNCCSQCKKINTYNKLLFMLGINRKRIIQKRNDVPVEKNKYWRIIQEYQK